MKTKLYLALALGLTLNSNIFARRKVTRTTTTTTTGVSPAVYVGAGAAGAVGTVVGGKYMIHRYQLSTNPGKVIKNQAMDAAKKRMNNDNLSPSEATEEFKKYFDTELDNQIKKYFKDEFKTNLSEAEFNSFKKYANILPEDSFGQTASKLTKALGDIKGTASSIDVTPQELLNRMKQLRAFNHGLNQDTEAVSSGVPNTGSDFESTMKSAKAFSQEQSGVTYSEEGATFSTNLGNYARKVTLETANQNKALQLGDRSAEKIAARSTSHSTNDTTDSDSDTLDSLPEEVE